MTAHKFQRKLSVSDLPPVPKKHCRWCGEPCPGKRRNWCSQVCVDEYMIRSSPSAVSRAIWARDRGVCALCGLDTSLLRSETRRYFKLLRDCHIHGTPNRQGPWKTHGRLWEADHVIPVIEGGGCCGLDGYRTLCLPCHRRETAALATRRAEKRKNAKNISTREAHKIDG